CPFAKIAEDEAAIAVFPKSACIIQHHAEFLVLELAPRLEVCEVDALKRGIVRSEDSNSPPFRGLNLFQISISLQQSHGGVKTMVTCIGKLPPRIAQEHSLSGAAKLREDILQDVRRRMTGVDEELRDPFVRIAE